MSSPHEEDRSPHRRPRRPSLSERATVAIAGSADDASVSGPSADKAKAAALAKLGGGTANSVSATTRTAPPGKSR